MPDVVTEIEAVVSPVLHNNTPVAVVDNTDGASHMLDTFTTGTAGVANGADIPIPAALGHPLIFWVTLYVPATATVIEEVVAPPGLQSKAPV